jgi:hypothetical protein
VAVLVALAVNRGAVPAPNSAPPSATPAALGPVTVAPPPSSVAAARGCPAVISRLPVVLDGRHSRPAVSASPYVAAWGEPPIVLRCGVPRPPAFVRTSELSVVNGVQWLPERQPGGVRWTVVDREVYVEALVPAGATSTSVVDLSAAISQALPAHRPQPGPG